MKNLEKQLRVRGAHAPHHTVHIKRVSMPLVGLLSGV